jgi:hypothetical protein
LSTINSFVKITPGGQFSLDGKRWMCNSVVYHGRFPGTCARDWLDDGHWELNQPELSRDFAGMARVGINHSALFFNQDSLFKNGKLLTQGAERMDEVVEQAKKAGIRVSIFVGPFIDKPEIYKQITGEEWHYDQRWLPSFNPHLHEAYVKQIAPFAERYKNEPAVMAFTDRIDRFHKGFDNLTIPFNLKDEWHGHLKAKFGSFKNLLDTVGGPGALENNPKDFNEVLLPHESKWNGSMKNPLGYEFILWQKQSIGDAQAHFDERINKLAPNQFVWTPFEGNTTTWAMLDGFTPKRKKLQAIWMEYYFFELTRPSFVQPFEEWTHTREVVHRRLSHQIPVIYTGAYTMARYIKQSVQQPVVICHGGWTESPAYGTDTYEQQTAIVDRVNLACLAADADGWHYWNWRDDEQSWHGKRRERFEKPEEFYFYGESLGMNTFDGFPKPVLSLVQRYSRECQRRADANPPAKKSDLLLLSSSARMYTLFRRMAVPTAAAMVGALSRIGIEPDVLWTGQDEVRIDQATLNSYRMIAMADNMFGRDFRDTPEKLLKYVEQGGTLYFAMDRFDRFEDEYGVRHENAAMAKLCGVDANGLKDWPGAHSKCHNWPFATDASQEPNMDIMAFPRLAWGVCPEFRHLLPYPEKLAFLGFRSTDDDNVTVIPGLVKGAEVIAVGKFPPGSRPLFYRHRIGKGTVYVNAWTNNVFRDSESRADYGGWEYDWMLDMPAQSAGVRDIDLTNGSSAWLRNTWGYFWRDMP